MTLAAAVALAWLGLAPASDFAQQPPPAHEARAAAGSLSARLAMSEAERLIGSPSSEDRVRSVVRLSSLGRREAVDRLVRAMHPGSPLARDPRARLAAVRGLFPFASLEPVRLLLASALSIEGPADSLAGIIRDTAALALASSDDAKAIGLLVVAVVQGGAAAEAAERALLAYPPRSLAPIAPAGRPGEGLPAAVCALVGKLGDLRAAGPLRATLAAGLGAVDPAAPSSAPSSPGYERRKAAIAAALALARLGDREPLPVARQWLRARDPELRIAAAEILIQGGAEERAGLLAEWMRSEETRARAVTLSLRMPSADLAMDLVKVARDESGSLLRMSIAALGRTGDGGAERALAGMLADPARAWDAAFALANSPSDEAKRTLQIALLSPQTRRLAARAGTARYLLRDDPPRRLVDALSSLRTSRDDADRAAGAFGLAVLGEVSVRSLLGSGDAAVVRAAARASLVVGGDAAIACAERLSGETDETTRDALGVALAASVDAADPISTGKLAEWAESDAAIAPLATLSLGLRDGPPYTERLERLLGSADPAIRRHAALGLGYSPEPDTSSRLSKAWHFETDRSVRRAIIAALSKRSEPQRIEVLGLASRMDPDADVREAARLGLQGRLPGILEGRGRCKQVAWITLSPSEAKSAPMLGYRRGRLAEASGLVLPVVTDPDGALVAAGLAPGPASFTLAMRFAPEQAPAHE